MSNLDDILRRIEALEKELAEELRTMEPKFLYTIRDRKVRFTAEVRRQHKALAQKWSAYVYESGVMHILTLPIIWSALIPALFLDLLVMAYQVICFPVYGIPMVKRREYIVLDRFTLRYLNIFEKCSCLYCEYFNGLMGYVREVAARTEQYWCPIRHARPTKAVHSRYRHFFAYGDAEGYRAGLLEVRKKFEDVKPKE